MITITYKKKQDYWTINCNRYSRDPKRRICKTHFIPYDKLENALLDTLKKTYKRYLELINISDIANEINNKRKNDFKTQEMIKSLINIENPTRKLMQAVNDKIVIDI